MYVATLWGSLPHASSSLTMLHNLSVILFQMYSCIDYNPDGTEDFFVLKLRSTNKQGLHHINKNHTHTHYGHERNSSQTNLADMIQGL